MASSTAAHTEHEILRALNPAQRAAVVHGEGPLLVYAGAGSGKTRVLSHRIAWLIGQQRVPPHRILAVTFTNKAADEMKGRIRDLIGDSFHGLWSGTFHSICARLLRMHGEQIGIPSDFVVFDTADQQSLVRDCLRQLNIDPERNKPQALLSVISQAKNELLYPEEFRRRRSGPEDAVVGRVYKAYQEALTRNHALDFDDLIAFGVHLLRRAPEVARIYQERFLHVLVD